MLCEESMIITEARSALLVPTKTQSNTWNIDKQYTNCGMTNHNVETCKKKKEHTTMATTEAT
jgi:hypothetical protein